MKIPVLLINLVRRPDRLAEISQHLSERHLYFEVIAAVDGMQPDLLDRYLTTPGDAACWMSHQLAFSALIESEARGALILEDDAQLAAGIDWPKLCDALPGILDECGVDVLQLGFISSMYRGKGIGLRERFARLLQLTREFDVLESSIGRIVLDDFRYGTHAYFLNRRAAISLLGVNVPVALSADNLLTALAHEGLPHDSLRVGRLASSLAEQASRRIGSEVIDSDNY